VVLSAPPTTEERRRAFSPSWRLLFRIPNLDQKRHAVTEGLIAEVLVDITDGLTPAPVPARHRHH
jgi:hypothetical protein